MGLWKAIRKEWNLLHDNIFFEMNNGKSVIF